MRTFIFEAVQRVGVPENWGKFLVGVPDMEWSRHSEVDQDSWPLLARLGWSDQHIWVCDLATGEGAWFRHGGNARADLETHRIWVCPLFEEFLKWLYDQNIEALHLLPPLVELPEAMFSIQGYRRIGPHDVSLTLRPGSTLIVEWGDEPRMVICEAVTEDGAVIRSLTAQETALLTEGLAEAEQLVRGETAEAVTGQDDPGPALPAGEVRALEAGDLAGQPDADAQETAVIPAVDDQETAVIPAVEAAADKPPRKK